MSFLSYLVSYTLQSTISLYHIVWISFTGECRCMNIWLVIIFICIFVIFMVIIYLWVCYLLIKTMIFILWVVRKVIFIRCDNWMNKINHSSKNFNTIYTNEYSHWGSFYGGMKFSNLWNLKNIFEEILPDSIKKIHNC